MQALMKIDHAYDDLTDAGNDRDNQCVVAKLALYAL
jgi:hypothetical protein